MKMHFVDYDGLSFTCDRMTRRNNFVTLWKGDEIVTTIWLKEFDIKYRFKHETNNDITYFYYLTKKEFV